MDLFSEIIAIWIIDVKRRGDLALSTKNCYARVARTLTLWAGETSCESPIELSSYLASRVLAGLTPRTLQLELRVAAAAWRWAHRHGLITEPGLLRVPKVRLNKGLYYLNPRTPSPAEAGAIIRVMPPDDWQLAIKLLARTGARIGEVLTLRRCDLDLSSRTLSFGCSADSCKTGARAFPLDDGSIQDLARRADGSTEPLLAFASHRSPHQAISRLLRAACDRAGVPRFTPHGLRRMVVTRLIRAGVDPGTAASLTGHTVQVMLRYYQQVSDDDRRTAVQKAGLGDIADK